MDSMDAQKSKEKFASLANVLATSTRHNQDHATAFRENAFNASTTLTELLATSARQASMAMPSDSRIVRVAFATTWELNNVSSAEVNVV